MDAKISVYLPDGSTREIPAGSSSLDLAGSIGSRLKQAALAARVNGQVVDLMKPLADGDKVEILTGDSPEALGVLRHSASHVLAQAVKHLFPEIKLAIGPAIKDGFYYDFDRPAPFTPEDFAAIEAEMQRIVNSDERFVRKEVRREEAIDFFQKRGEVYKVELVEDLPAEAAISFYESGDFVDLCAGPHIPSVGAIKAFKLLSVAGAYWRGDEHRPMLQRIYATAFTKPKDLEDYLKRIEEAKLRDHRKLGRELKLFELFDEGPGFPFYLPYGMAVRNELEQFWREQHQKAGYLEVKTPIILNRQMWERSGHWDHYRENMYFTKIDDIDYAVKPMNCPGAMLVYGHELHSYRDLPLRYAELGLVHRHELSGVLNGLLRVRNFTQDDAHIFCTPEQIFTELNRVIDLVDSFYKKFGFNNYMVELSTRPENSMGSDELWENATSALERVLKARSINYKVNEGDGAFYGPKIDFHLEDCLGRTWQCSTVQLDFQMPEKFDLSYIGEDGEKHRPVVIHRVVYGSIERFFAMLIEQYAGAFPTWLAPVQVKVIPITDRQHEYARKLQGALIEAGVRSEIDERNEKMGFKIREAQMMKVPYMLVVGEREEAQGEVSVRQRSKGDLGTRSFDAFVADLKQEINERRQG
jgi:threonyl-tRNA synthetase